MKAAAERLRLQEKLDLLEVTYTEKPKELYQATFAEMAPGQKRETPFKRLQARANAQKAARKASKKTPA